MKVEQQKDSKQKKIVQIEDLSVSFDGMEVVKHVNIEVNSGEIVGIVGESGSGKSITSLTLMGLLSKQAQVTSGKIIVDGEVLREADRPFDERLYRRFQGSRMSMIFQEPMTSLNPTKKAGVQVDEIVRLHTDLEKEKRYEKVLETFQAVGLKDAKKVYDSYPHQLSGGMRQRVMIAMAVILHPDLIIADEPTTALDVTIQTQIVELLKDINKSEQNAMLFITHDLNLARRICHKVVVMKDGVVVEADETEKIFMHPKEAYTRNLIEAVPSRLKPRVSVKKESNTKVLTVKDLSVYYEDRSNSIFKKKEKQYAVEHVSFDVYEGESLGLVGESGCGKSTTAGIIMGHMKNYTGNVTIDGNSLSQISEASLNLTFAEESGDDVEAEKYSYLLDQLMSDNATQEFLDAVNWALDQEDYATPFDMEGYVDSYFEDAWAVLDESEALLEQGKQDNSNGDKFGLVTVIYSVVLFMLGIVGTFKKLPNRYIITGVAIAGFLFATIYMFTIPMPTGFNLFGFFG